MENETSYQRYQRQMILPEWGVKGQRQLANAHVLVIGAGGLGCPLLLYLAAAGVGHLGIADDDTVEETNLHRQVLFGGEDLGKQKAVVAAQKLKALHPDVCCTVYTERWQQQHCIDFFGAYDIIVDGTDNFATKYLINDGCVLLQKPLVYGAVSQYEGQVAVFNNLMPDGRRSAHYRHLFPEPPAPGSIRNCAVAGVVGMVPGIIGSMQAAEVVKLITGIGQPLVNKMLYYDILYQTVFIAAIPNTNEALPNLPVDLDAYLGTNYEWLCGDAFEKKLEIGFEDLKQIPAHTYLLVDVRERHEQPRLTGLERIEIPMGELENNLDVLEGKQVVFICQTGQRSKQAAQWLSNLFPDMHVRSLKEGAVAIGYH